MAAMPIGICPAARVTPTFALRLGRLRLADPFEFGQVVLLAGAHEEVFLLAAVALLRVLDDPAVVDGDLTGPDHLELLSLDDDRGALVEADAEHFRVRRD